MQRRRLDSSGRAKVSQELEAIAPDYDYLVPDMSLPNRAYQKSSLYSWLQKRGYRLVAAFKSETPIFGADLFHAVNPEIVIFARLSN
jgi:hypothetical protein